MQDPGVLQSVLLGNESMSELGELAFLENERRTTRLRRQPQSLRACSPIQRSLHAGSGQWMTTSFKPLRKQGLDLRCSASCRCICHSILAKRLPEPMWKTFQLLFSKMKGELGLVFRCRRLDCRMRNRGRARVIVLHNSLLKRAIEASVLLHGFRIKLRFRVQRVVSESSDIVRFARMGDFESFKHHIRTGMATVFDATEDGWTTLHVQIPALFRHDLNWLTIAECRVPRPPRDS